MKWEPPVDRFTISLFGIAAGQSRAEQEALTSIIRRFVSAGIPLRIRLLGEFPASIRLPTQCSPDYVEFDAPGYLPSDRVAQRLAHTHVYLSFREALSTRSGSLAAALACDLPVIGYRGAETAPPLTDGRVELLDGPDVQAVAERLLRLARDPGKLLGMSRGSHGLAEELSWPATMKRLVSLLS